MNTTPVERPFRVLLLVMAMMMGNSTSIQAAFQGKPVKVFIFSGQSNMVGSGTNSTKAPEALRIQPNILYDVTRSDNPGTISSEWEILGNPIHQMGPELTSIALLEEAFPNEQICAIKVSAPGTGLYYWRLPGQPGHDTLMARITAISNRLDTAVANGDIPSWSFDGFLWMQGENEANAKLGPAEAYQENFDDLVYKVRTLTETSNLPVVVGRISILLDPAMGGPVNQPQLDQVREGQVNWATNDAQGAWVNTDDLTLIDDWHFGSVSQVTLGKRFAEAWFQAAETRPRLTLVRAAGQADWSDGTTILYTATFSEAVNGFDALDVTILGDTGAEFVTVTEVAPSDGSTYEISVEGMNYPGIVNVAVANAAATTGSLDSLPSFAENTEIVWAKHHGVADLILYDPMTQIKRKLDGAGYGIGWQGNGWEIQSDKLGYEIESDIPLTYTHLLSSPGYAFGGDSYVSSGRQFDLETTFRPWMTDRNAGAVNVPGTTLWFSYLVRPQIANQKYIVSLNRGEGIAWGSWSPTVTVEEGTNGNWHLNVLGNDIDTGVAIILDRTDLMVLKLEIGGASSPSKTHLWVNPNSNWLGGTAPKDASATVSNSITSTDYNFSRLYWMPGYVTEASVLDEIRIGTTFASVTPSDVVVNGDFDFDNDIDKNDLDIMKTRFGQNATTNDPYDINKDGIINGLDFRQVIKLCTRPRCAN